MVDHIAFGFGHFLTVLIAHERMNIDMLKWLFVHKMQTKHHHPGDPEKDDIKASYQRIGLVVGRQFISFFSGQPSVEKGQRADENQVSSTSSSRSISVVAP